MHQNPYDSSFECQSDTITPLFNQAETIHKIGSFEWNISYTGTCIIYIDFFHIQCMYFPIYHFGL